MTRLLRRLTLCSLLAVPTSLAAQNTDAVTVTTQQLAPGVSMLTGAGGNIGVSSGKDGTVIIDDQFASMADKIRVAIMAISPNAIRFVLNTHWHGDHTGGNERFTTESGALIVAQDNVRKRMSTEQVIAALHDTVHASPAASWPVITFTDTVTFYLNGDTIQVFHVAPAHTDGDAMIRFVHANVVHTGDTFFNGFYPFIDLSSGGSIDGMIAATARALAISDANTKIIPGHGPLADRAALERFHDMLVGTRAGVAKAMKGGKSLDAVVKANPTAKFDAAWGGGFMKPEQYIAQVYADLKKRGV